MPKVTFVYSDYECLGVEYLMAVSRKQGYEVDLVFYESLDCLGEKACLTESFVSAIAKRIVETQPSIVCFSCVTDQYQYQLRCARALKDILPEVVTVFGGIHATSVPERVIREQAVDCIAIGEAENSFSLFLSECGKYSRCVPPARAVKGMVCKVDGKLIGNFTAGDLPDLNTLPFPYKKAFYAQFAAFSREYLIMTSRGCPYRCSYCFNSSTAYLSGGSVVRQRNVDNVIDELIEAKVNYAPQSITFEDDCFTINESWVLEFCERYAREVRIPFRCLTMPQYLNERKINALRTAGCYHVQMGVQSLDEGLCSRILQRRSESLELASAISSLKRAGITVQVDHMLGIPEGTVEVDERAAVFYNEVRPHVISVFWLTYYPKTEILRIAKGMNLLSDQDIENINEGIGLTGRSFKTGGSVREPGQYYGIHLLLNWIPFLPKRFVSFFIKSKLYRRFVCPNFFLSLYLPRFLLAIFNRKNFSDRELIIQFMHKVFRFRRRVEGRND